VSPFSVDPNRISESVGHRRITVRVRFPRIAFLFAWAVSLALPLAAQSPNGTINGLVLDPSNKIIAGADILVINDVTGVKYSGKTNDEGIYIVPNLPPGPYRLQVSKVGFKTLVKPDIILNIQDALSINFTLPLGAVFEIVTVEGGASMINTTDASVSTVIDHSYVENMPLNGRSFQDLILLTPGVVTNSPQSSAGLGYSGEFSVNGQRTESNYYTVDGVSANVGIAAGNPVVPSMAGSLPSATALGTTQALLSVDAMEEFRVQSSTYSAEYGRSPGGQFSFATRPGTNEWHGTAYDYLRNNLFDANDWFSDYYHSPEPPLRQNDFGTTLGGPVTIPNVYNGKDRTFFFFSYEGLRLLQPQEASINYVPTTALRSSAPSALQPVLNAFPLPTPTVSNCVADLGNGLSEFCGSWSNPSSINSYSIRLDQIISQKLRLFFRFGNTPSSSDTRGVPGPSAVSFTDYVIRTYTVGATSSLTGHLSNDFRLNYSSNESTGGTKLDNFGDAQVANLFQLQGINVGATPTPGVVVVLAFPGYSAVIQQAAYAGQQKQWNLVDTMDFSTGKHQIRFGVDYRRLAPVSHVTNPLLESLFFSEASVQADSIDEGLAIAEPIAYPLYTNFSAFVQDGWKASPRLNLSGGIRWEVNPAPGVTQGLLPYTVEGSTLATLTLAPEGTPLWKTSWFSLAPRLGVDYVLRNSPGYETVVRGGFGVFFDTGQQLGSYGYYGPGFSAYNYFGSLVGAPASFPAVGVVPSVVNPPVPPYGVTYAFPAHLQLPFTLQWNASLEQALGKAQAFTISYVGSNGRRLLEQNQINVSSVNPNFQNDIVFNQNGLTSDYNALQVQFRRRLSGGLTALASYTWSHCLDYGSNDVSLPYMRGNCDFDVRNNVSAAISYSLPNSFQNALARTILEHWGIDDRFTARTGFPLTLLSGNTVVNPATGQTYQGGLDLVQGVPIYLYGSQFPGGRSINPAAFIAPPSNEVGDAPRNFVRGFGAWQMDMAVRRDFPIHENLKLQFRAEAFNMFNHPNFGTINSTYCAAGSGCTFGQATGTLANSLGVLSPLYQMGGPRSMQFALKVVF
jgi:hypothetical protein